MHRTWLIIFAVVLALGASQVTLAADEGSGSVIAGIGGTTMATGTVTFQVDMSVRLCEGGMIPADVVSVPGSFNGWAPGINVLTDGDGDSIYTGTFDIAEGTIMYKFHDGNDWESTPDRSYTVVAGAQTVPLVFFNDDNMCDPPGGDVPVTFQVDMSVKIAEGSFDPLYLGEWVRPLGTFNGWAGGDSIFFDDDGDEVYVGTLMLAEGSMIEYKWVVREDDGSDTWEDGSNRTYTVPTGGGTIPVVWFNNDSVVSIPVTQNILLKTDLNAYFEMGWFQPSIDSVQVRGAFNSWVGSVCEDPLSALEYEYLVQNFSGFSNDQFFYKFFLDFDEATAPTRFPGWMPGSGADGYGYEHPAERGDGNRVFILPSINGNVGPDVYWYSSIHRDGILFSPDTVRVTLTADMAPAIAGGFDPNTDTVKIVWEDALWRSIQILEQGVFPQVWNMTRQGLTNTYTLTFTVHGNTHYNMQYRLRYTGPNGEVTEGGGLGVQNPYRTRFIQPLGPNSFPTSYSAPTDVWDTDGAPLPGEAPYFQILNSVELEPGLGQPVAYRLVQNYPNPFNPATRIRYTLPERSAVTLKVFNVLGQQVGTLVNEVQEQGNYVALFDAKGLASGVYYYRLEAGDFTQTMKMLLMK
jgi:hypothetical protein